MLTTTWLLIALSVAGFASWTGRRAQTPVWRDERLVGGLAAGAVGLAVPPQHPVHGVLTAGATGLLASFVSTEVASTSSREAADDTFGSWAPWPTPAMQYAFVS